MLTCQHANMPTPSPMFVLFKPRDSILENAALSSAFVAHLCTQTWSAGDMREKQTNDILTSVLYNYVDKWSLKFYGLVIEI